MVMGREYHRNYSRAYYHRRKQEAREFLGNSCAVCGATEDLEFDHIEPGHKKFSIGKLLSFSKAVMMTELKKCQLLCHEHHKEKTVAFLRMIQRKGGREAYYTRFENESA